MNIQVVVCQVVTLCASEDLSASILTLKNSAV